MNLRKMTLKYMGWCPGVKSASRFIPEKEIHRTHGYLLVIIVALGFSVPYLLYFEPEPPPSWIIAYESGTQTSPGTLIKIGEEDLSKYLKLAAVIKQADDAVRPGVLRTPPGPMVKMTHDEGREIVALLEDEYKDTVKTYSFKVWVEGKVYSIRIDFAKEPPKMA